MKTTLKNLPVLAVIVLALPVLPARADNTSSPAFGEPGTTVRVSVGSNGAQLLEFSDAASISPDGRYVSFVTGNSARGRFKRDLYIHDRLTGVSAAVATARGTEASFSGDGRFLALTN